MEVLGQLLISNYYPKLIHYGQVLLMTLQNAPPGLDYERDNKFSKVSSFKKNGS